MKWILMCLTWSYLQTSTNEGWLNVKGADLVSSWSVNETCNRVRVTAFEGKTKEYVLKQYIFMNGDHSIKSLLPLGPHLLLVTHQHGAFLVNDRGSVVRELSEKPPKSFEAHGITMLPAKNSEGEYDFWLRARSWDGRTIVLSDSNAVHSYIVLMNKQLVRTVAFEFGPKKTIVSIQSEGSGTWLVGVRSKAHTEFWKVGNQGGKLVPKTKPGSTK